MKYTIHSTTAYGIYNGVSERDICDRTSQIAKELKLSSLDYELRDVVREIKNDQSLLGIAQETYEPYPEHENWSEEYRDNYRKMVEKRIAPGEADIPDDLIYEKVYAILKRIADEIVPPREAEKAAREKEYSDLMQTVDRVDTDQRTTTDEGGKTTVYHHRVIFKSGSVLEYDDRNIFDFGRVINPTYSVMEGLEPGGICMEHEGVLSWMSFDKENDWYPVRALTDEEVIATELIAKFHGHNSSRIRM